MVKKVKVNVMELSNKGKEVLSQFGERLAIARKKRNLTGRELAAKMKVTQSAISTYEARGQLPNSFTLISICECLRTHPNYLFGYSDQIEIRNYAAVLEDILKKMGYDDQKFVFKFIKLYNERRKSEVRKIHPIVAEPDGFVF